MQVWAHLQEQMAGNRPRPLGVSPGSLLRSGIGRLKEIVPLVAEVPPRGHLSPRRTCFLCRFLQRSGKSAKDRRCSRPVSNRGPFACEANVITTTLRKPCSPAPLLLASPSLPEHPRPRPQPPTPTPTPTPTASTGDQKREETSSLGSPGRATLNSSFLFSFSFFFYFREMILRFSN